jgi:hypothetical protein
VSCSQSWLSYAIFNSVLLKYMPHYLHKELNFDSTRICDKIVSIKTSMLFHTPYTTLHPYNYPLLMKYMIMSGME